MNSDNYNDFLFLNNVRDRYGNSETEEGLVIRRLIEMYEKQKSNAKEKAELLRSVQEELRTISDNSKRDELTGLYNRKAIIPYFRSIMDSNADRNSLVSLITIDLDHFKSVNDTYGHNVGDDVLKIVSEGLIRYFRKKDLIVRDGGDEFLVVTINCDLPILKHKADEVSNYITESIHKDLDNKKDEYGKFITRPHDYTISYGIREMDKSKLGYINGDEDFYKWFKEEKDYADKDAYVMKQSHHAIRK